MHPAAHSHHAKNPLVSCRLAGGEYRDPHFLFDYGSQTFRDLSEECCTAMLVAPMKNDMPIYNAQANVAQRLRTPPTT